MSYLWPDVELSSDSSDDVSSDKGGKYQENIDNQEQEEVVSFQRRNPSSLIRGDQISLRQLKNKIESSRDKLFFIKNIAAGSSQAKWYLVQVDSYQLDMVSTRYYGVYQLKWYTRHHEDCNQHRTMECHFWMEIREMNRDETFGKMFPVRPLRINGFLQK